MLKTVREAVNINYWWNLMFKTVRGAVNIDHWWFTESCNHVIAHLVVIFRLQNLGLEMRQWWTFEKSKNRQLTTSDWKIEIVTRFDTDYFFIEYFLKFNYNINSRNTNKNIFLKYLATKTIESKKITLLVYYTK